MARQDSTSIHPGVVSGRRIFPKVNTCANSSLAKRLTRQLVGIEEHVARHPRDGVSQSRAATIKRLLVA